MLSIHVEIPSGAVSRGYEYDNTVKAQNAFVKIGQQLAEWKDFTADVIFSEEGVEVDRWTVRNAA